MKRNKKVKKCSRYTVNSINIVALIVLVFIALMVYWSQDAHCSALSQEIGKAKREYKKLESDCQREASSWDELKTPDNLSRALVRHGIDMGPANQEQIIHMGTGGQPKPGQISVARIRTRRARTTELAKVQPATTMRAVSGRTRTVAPRSVPKANQRRR